MLVFHLNNIVSNAYSVFKLLNAGTCYYTNFIYGTFLHSYHRRDNSTYIK